MTDSSKNLNKKVGLRITVDKTKIHKVENLLPLRRSSFTVARQIFFGLPLCLFPTYGIQFMVVFAGRISGWQRMWPVNWMCLFATIWLKFLDSARLITSPFLILSVQDFFKVSWRQLKWNTSRRFVILVVDFHVSHAYKAVERTIEL